MKEGASAPLFFARLYVVVSGFLDTVYCGRYGRTRARCRGCARPALRWCVFLGGAGPLPRPLPPLGACIGGVALGAQGPVAPPLSRARLARAGPQRYAGPAAPLALAACAPAPARAARGAGCGWRGSIRALRGAARGSALLPAGRVGPSAPQPRLRCGSPPAAGGALPRLRSGSGCVSSPSPRSAGAASAPALRPPAPGGPSGSPRRASLPPALPAAGRAALGFALVGRACSPRPRRCVVLGLSRWCACGRGNGDSAACGRRG